MKFSKKALVNVLMILIVVLLAVLPLIFVKNAEFGGADGQAEEVISEVNGSYVPWFTSLFEPASGEIESLLFALQAALGAGILGYGLGYYRGKKETSEKKYV